MPGTWRYRPVMVALATHNCRNGNDTGHSIPHHLVGVALENESHAVVVMAGDWPFGSWGIASSQFLVMQIAEWTGQCLVGSLPHCRSSTSFAQAAGILHCEPDVSFQIEIGRKIVLFDKIRSRFFPVL